MTDVVLLLPSTTVRRGVVTRPDGRAYVRRRWRLQDALASHRALKRNWEFGDSQGLAGVGGAHLAW